MVVCLPIFLTCILTLSFDPKVWMSQQPISFPYTALIVFELAKASPANDCLVYEKPHKAIWVFISVG